ncbi:FO synthase [Kineococcus rhizosphaerae]|uniref:FO synthase subunit 2 n=1 Tax=Kineococcus rhizosphaerae TaxID=559628 RepID=A0A2T0R0Q9_9ACTN|nr:FO synthase [Kineococcus rhizosphaerae]PRY12894.1 FO synthase subunit 2 [Kineococcus rhizosphaerae]
MPDHLLDALAVAADDPAQLSDDHALALLGADGDDLERLAATADALRRARVGDDVTFVVNRNLDAERVGADLHHVRDLVAEAVGLGATEVCVQGPVPVAAGPKGYLELVRAVREAGPGVHLHAFRVPEVLDAAHRRGSTVREFLLAARDAGLGSVPGTAAKVLDDGVRTRLNGGVPDLPVAEWVRVLTTAHEVGLTSTSVLVHGGPETGAQQVAHLRLLAAIARRTGGVTEFIAMPAPWGDPSPRAVRALHAVARLLLDGAVDHVQVAWPKHAPGLVTQLLAGGGDDLGGLLLDGVLDPAAGQEAGTTLTRQRAAALTGGRPLRQRTTRYGRPAPV